MSTAFIYLFSMAFSLVMLLSCETMAQLATTDLKSKRMANESGAEGTRNYDVFLCFGGPHTRSTFAGNLCNALRLKRINTFFFPDPLNLNQVISTTTINDIPKAIQESRISIVVLSEDFASSSWCLDHLVNILECMSNQLVWPIFYNVKAWEVRDQQGQFGHAMSQLIQQRFGHSNGRVHQWSQALFQVSNMAGWSYETETGYEYELIQKIVDLAVQSIPRHDVFLSFSGEDTRYSFTGFLYKALRREGFKAFMDDEGLVSGNEIAQALITAIEKSRLSIVVFSENYGYSSWCLDELAKIIECMKTKNQLVLPIFYKVEQSDVSNQTKSFGDAMTAHEKRFGKDSEKVQKWRSALSEIANMKGEHLKENEYEYEFIQRIVEMAIDFENHQQIPIPSPCSEVN